MPNLQDATGFPHLLPRVRVLRLLLDRTGDELEHPLRLHRVLQLRPGSVLRSRRLRGSRPRGREGVNYFLTIPIAGLARRRAGRRCRCARVPARLLRGEIFALLTLAVTFTLAAIAPLSTWVDGGQGIAITIPSYPAFLGEYQDLIYRLGLWPSPRSRSSAFLIQNSRFGWGLFSIRDEEDVAEELGVPTFRYKMLAITITGCLGALSGAVAALQIGYLTPEGVFNLTVPLLVVVMSVLGGRRHWLGPVIGALVIYSLQERLTNSRLRRVGPGRPRRDPRRS